MFGLKGENLLIKKLYVLNKPSFVFFRIFEISCIEVNWKKPNCLYITSFVQIVLHHLGCLFRIPNNYQSLEFFLAIYRVFNSGFQDIDKCLFVEKPTSKSNLIKEMQPSLIHYRSPFLLQASVFLLALLIGDEFWEWFQIWILKITLLTKCLDKLEFLH